MYKDEIIYGIALLSGKEFRCYTVNISGAHVDFKLIASDTEHLQKKQKKGGQSAPRFERIRQEKELHYVKKMTDVLVKSYMHNNHTKCIIEKLIIAGPADLKKDVVDSDLFQQYFSTKLVKVLSSTEISDNTIYDIYNQCSDIFINSQQKNSDESMEEIYELLRTNCDKLIFGQSEVMTNLQNKTLCKLLIDEDINDSVKATLDTLSYKNLQIFEIEHDKIKEYGSMIGILTFIQTTN